MTYWQIYLTGLLTISLFALAGWIFSLVRDDVTHVDSMWSLFLGMSAFSYTLYFYHLPARTILILVLVTIWAIRLSAYLTWRNWGKQEDHRYAEIRNHNAPFFWLKSIYIIFGLQAVLAWIISLPLFVGVSSTLPLNIFDYMGAGLVVFGIAYESIADWQLSKFKANQKNAGKVLNTGLWRHTRHPNYFGECCVWWGFYFIALATGGWWSIASPLIMTFLLLKFSGVVLLEKDITHRRPEYAQYIKHTSAFIPLPKKH